MQIVDDIQTLYSEAAKELRTSDDAKLEALRLRIAQGDVFGTGITPALLARLLDETAEEAAAHFAALRSAGFIQSSLTQFSWANLDPHDRARTLDNLSMIEANVALRCRYLDMKPVLPALQRLAGVIEQHAQNDELLEVCLAVQRLFLVLVATVNAPPLFREYAAYANASTAYAWSMAQNPGAAMHISDMICSMIEALKKGDGVSAARAATYLRSMPTGEENLAVPLCG
ncbi:hypothetical protein [Novosphingobium sp. AP12]|uniref:hypothetical protein n=1 Tax=Novosphingobium sp. AP12 TaxID=1144305 RepID=UPI000271F66F|nr:hypothetical protein [Novosphingobium sp. AP12]EJL24246.1 hypothetical protein PMI02_03748 [Novosphingobium sp. AP12]